MQKGDDKLQLREEFIQFIDTESTTGEAIANKLIGVLRDNGINLQKLRGQGYDGAKNMSGKTKGYKIGSGNYARKQFMFIVKHTV